MSEVRLRRAVAGDATELAAFAERAFRAAYTGIMKQEHIERYVREVYGEAMQREEIERAESSVLVLEQAGRIAGYAWVWRGPAPPCVTMPDATSLMRLYVDPSLQSRGEGRRLIRGAEAEARGMGAPMLWLAVWDKNPRAIRFYMREGYSEIGRTGFWGDLDPECDLVMAKGLLSC